jgi:hypothetical protein
MQSDSRSTTLTDALAEVLHYVRLRWALPSIHQTVSNDLLSVEALALSIGYVDHIETGYAVTDTGAAWLSGWGAALGRVEVVRA